MLPTPFTLNVQKEILRCLEILKDRYRLFESYLKVKLKSHFDIIFVNNAEVFLNVLLEDFCYVKEEKNGNIRNALSFFSDGWKVLLVFV